MIDFLFDYPALYMSIASGLVFTIITTTGIMVMKRFVRGYLKHDGFKNDIVEVTLSGFSSLYGILLGLLAVGAYENLNNMEDVIS